MNGHKSFTVFIQQAGGDARFFGPDQQKQIGQGVIDSSAQRSPDLNPLRLQSQGVIQGQRRIGKVLAGRITDYFHALLFIKLQLFQ